MILLSHSLVVQILSKGKNTKICCALCFHGTTVEGIVQHLIKGDHMNYIECINVDYKSNENSHSMVQSYFMVFAIYSMVLFPIVNIVFLTISWQIHNMISKVVKTSMHHLTSMWRLENLKVCIYAHSVGYQYIDISIMSVDEENNQLPFTLFQRGVIFVDLPFLHSMLHCYSFKFRFVFYFPYNVLIARRCVMHSLYSYWCLLYSVVSLTQIICRY